MEEKRLKIDEKWSKLKKLHYFCKNTAHNEVAFSYRTTAEGEVGK